MLEAILESSIELTHFLQSIDWLMPLMEALTFLGRDEFYMLVMPVLFWSIDYRLGMRVGVVVLTGNSLKEILKMAFHLPRPFWYDAGVTGMGEETSFGLPSGHSMIPAITFGLIAHHIKRGWVWAVSLALIFLVGLSRVALGVHFTIDVLAGWALAIGFLWAFLRLEAPVTAWFKKQDFSRQVGGAFSASLLIILLAMVVLTATASFEMPAEWEINAGIELNSFSVEAIITSAGSLFGLATGYFWLTRRGGFDAGGMLWARAARFVIGVIGVLAIVEGLDMVFPDSADVVGYSFRYLRYALVGFWIAGGAPVVFKKAGLAE